jgi:hypothetical protein
MEGYRTELNQLRSRLQQVEKLYKAFVIYRKTDVMDKAVMGSSSSSSRSSSSSGGSGGDGRHIHISKNNSGMDSRNAEHDCTSAIDEY